MLLRILRRLLHVVVETTYYVFSLALSLLRLLLPSSDEGTRDDIITEIRFYFNKLVTLIFESIKEMANLAFQMIFEIGGLGQVFTTTTAANRPIEGLTIFSTGNEESSEASLRFRQHSLPSVELVRVLAVQGNRPPDRCSHDRHPEARTIYVQACWGGHHKLPRIHREAYRRIHLQRIPPLQNSPEERVFQASGNPPRRLEVLGGLLPRSRRVGFLRLYQVRTVFKWCDRNFFNG